MLALARLRLSPQGRTFLRELHVYGKATIIGTQGPVQGNKIGSIILHEVELYAKAHEVNELFVNAAHGAKPFFRKKGYLDKENNLLAKTI
ncbi:MAG: GNAT family N-acetyltransferase [Victivallaceae bacterium]